AASLADYFTCDCPPSRQLGLAFLVSPRYLPTLPSEIQRHLRPSQPVLRTRLIQEKNKREAGVGQQLQHLQSRPGHRIFPPHPVLPQVNYCRQPTVHSFRRPQTTGAVQIEALPHRVRLTPRTTTTNHALRNVNLLRVPNSCSSFCFFPPIFLLLFPLSFYNYRSITLLKLDSASLCAK
ncbi:hypothetical protein CMEL01_08565, partial [Colletotrichum melonis]